MCVRIKLMSVVLGRFNNDVIKTKLYQESETSVSQLYFMQ